MVKVVYQFNIKGARAMNQKPVEWLSDCHNAPVKVVGGDEGTNHWECIKCGKSCNANQKPVDDRELENIIKWRAMKGFSTWQFDQEHINELAEDLNAYYQKKYLGLLPEKSKLSHELKDADWKQFKNPKLSEEQYNMWVRGRNQAIDEALANIGGSNDQ